MNDLVRSTQYGYRGDRQSDSYTRAGLGMRNNPLTPHSAALTQLEQMKLNANPGDVLDLIDSKGKDNYEYFADRAPESDARVDLYKPQGFDPSVEDYQKVVNLGGGSPKLSGKALATTGEANIANLASSGQKPVPVSPSPVSAPNPSPPAQVAQTSRSNPILPLPQFNIALNPALSQSPVQQQSQAPMNQPDILSSFYAKHPVFAAFQGIS